jgi:hypothetical protein
VDDVEQNLELSKYLRGRAGIGSRLIDSGPSIGMYGPVLVTTEVREALGWGFPKPPLHQMACIGALVRIRLSRSGKRCLATAHEWQGGGCIVQLWLPGLRYPELERIAARSERYFSDDPIVCLIIKNVRAA